MLWRRSCWTIISISVSIWRHYDYSISRRPDRWLPSSIPTLFYHRIAIAIVIVVVVVETEIAASSCELSSPELRVCRWHPLLEVARLVHAIYRMVRLRLQLRLWFRLRLRLRLRLRPHSCPAQSHWAAERRLRLWLWSLRGRHGRRLLREW
jgi:hypothetical protein